MKITALFAIAVLAGCSARPGSPEAAAEPPPVIVPREPRIIGQPVTPDVDEETLNYAVLRAVQNKLDNSLNGSSARGLGKEDVLRRVKDLRYKIECIRAWAKTLPNEQVSREYAKWLDYYEGRYSEAEKTALRPQITTEADERYKRTQRALTASKFLEIPKPKDCAAAETGSTIGN